MEPASSSSDSDSDAPVAASVDVPWGRGGGAAGRASDSSASESDDDGAPDVGVVARPGKARSKAHRAVDTLDREVLDMPLGERQKLMRVRGMATMPLMSADTRRRQRRGGGKAASHGGAGGESADDTDDTDDSNASYDTDDSDAVGGYGGRQAGAGVGAGAASAAPSRRERRTGGVPAKRANKNCPVEVSSRRRPPRVQPAVTVPKRVVRDPRFERTAGTFSDDLFRKSYSFLDDMQSDEVKRLKRALKKTKGKRQQAEIQRELTHVQQSLAERKREAKVHARLAAMKREEAEKVAGGKTPYFLSRKAKAAVVREVREEELKRRGGVAALEAKKEKRRKLRQKIAARRPGGSKHVAGPRLGI